MMEIGAAGGAKSTGRDQIATGGGGGGKREIMRVAAAAKKGK
jgi:hypothetical protein